MRFLSMLLFRCDALLSGESMNKFWSSAAISPSTTRRVFFRGRELLRVSGCGRLHVPREEGYGLVRARGSSSRIQAATEMGCIEGGEKCDVELMLFWYSRLRLAGQLPCPCAQCADRSNAQPHHQDYFHSTPNNSTNMDPILAAIEAIDSRDPGEDFSYN